MKRFASIVVAGALLLAFAGTAAANIGWAGNIWPVNGTPYTSNDDINVYVQVWKDGCTGPAGPCADITATLFYRCSGGTDFTEVAMPYFGVVGNNDEFMGTIPHTHGCAEVEFYVMVVDAEDGETLYPPDQHGNSPNFFLPITPATSQDVLVTFTLCLTSNGRPIAPTCITGSHPELTNWGMPGLVMDWPCIDVSPNLVSIDVLFPTGSNPYVEYKYQRDGCTVWDCDPNHSFTIDDSQPTQVLPLDTWCWGTPDCPPCASPVEDSSWGTIKALYR